MLRIFGSLPRTHRLLLLPVTTMIGVLGTHQAYQNMNTSSDTEEAVADIRQFAQPIGMALANETALGGPEAGEQARLNMATALATAGHPPTDIGHSPTDASGPMTVDVETAMAVASNIAAMQAVAALEMDAQQDVMTSDRRNPLDARASSLVVANRFSELGSHTSYVDNFSDDEQSYASFSSDELESSLSLSNQVVAHEPYTPEWQTYKVQAGDTFAETAEHSFGLGYSEVLALLDSAPENAMIDQMRVGDELDYKVDRRGNLLALRIMKSSRTGYLFERDDIDQQFAVRNIERTGEATQRLFAGTVSGSFGSSARATGLSGTETAELIEVLGKKFNFNRESRDGDRFQVLIESDMIDGKPYDSRILAAQYEGRNDLTVVRHDDSYYTPDGQGLDAAFNRHPFQGDYRISSSFNLKRKHPVTGRISPHKGTDFAMPIGTPVEAPADGRVTRVVNHPLAGKYVVISHDNGFRTRYLHLSRAVVKPGERVKMGQEIAKSGNSGRSTGPHLHYEIIANGSQVNAMRVKLPEGRALSGQALASFKAESRELLAKLNDADSERSIAQVRHAESDESGSDS